jgi:hypothetical protein
MFYVRDGYHTEAVLIIKQVNKKTCTEQYHDSKLTTAGYFLVMFCRVLFYLDLK